jgi:hypothetical protein
MRVFKILQSFPLLTTKEYGSWLAEVAILQELYFYSYLALRFFSQRIFLFTKRVLNCRLNFNSFKVVVWKIKNFLFKPNTKRTT